MTARIPAPPTALGTTPAGVSGTASRLVAELELGLAAARQPGAPTVARLRQLAGLGRRIDVLFQRELAALRLRDPHRQRRALVRRTLAVQEEAYAIAVRELLPALRARGLALAHWSEIGEAARAALARAFAAEISPLLTPLTVDATHPFPWVASLAVNVGVLVREPLGPGERYVGIEVTPALPRTLAVPGSDAVVCIEDVIAAQLPALLPGLEPIACHAFRVTRDGRPLRAAVGTSPSPRRRAAVRLEIDPATPEPMRAILRTGLGLADDDVHPVAGPLDLGALASLPLARARERLGRLAAPGTS